MDTLTGQKAKQEKESQEVIAALRRQLSEAITAKSSAEYDLRILKASLGSEQVEAILPGHPPATPKKIRTVKAQPPPKASSFACPPPVQRSATQPSTVITVSQNQINISGKILCFLLELLLYHFANRCVAFQFFLLSVEIYTKLLLG